MPSATPTPTPAHTPTAPAAEDQFPSPNGAYHAIRVWDGVEIVAADGRRAKVTWHKWGRFVGWTADSGFALVSFHDQYGNSGTYVFATENWIEIDLVPAGCFANTSGSCKRGIAAVAPTTPRILLRDGTLVHLPTMAHTNVLTTTDESSIVQAAWSPSESYLAFTARDADRVPVLYVAGGSGEPVKEITELNPEDRWAESVTVTWTPSGDEVTVETERNRYTIDVATGRVEVVPIPEGGGAP